MLSSVASVWEQAVPHPASAVGSSVRRMEDHLSALAAWLDAPPEDAAAWVLRLGDSGCSIAPTDLAALRRTPADRPGLYSWFADANGAADLSLGLGQEVVPGLVYVGQTGATRWPSGTPSKATLVSRLWGQHLRGRRSSSTLGAVLDARHDTVIDRDDLTSWMFAHLRVVPAPTTDRYTLSSLERDVVQAMDPPLNLDHVGASPVRVRLRELRATADPFVR